MRLQDLHGCSNLASSHSAKFEIDTILIALPLRVPLKPPLIMLWRSTEPMVSALVSFLRSEYAKVAINVTPRSNNTGI